MRKMSQFLAGVFFSLALGATGVSLIAAHADGRHGDHAQAIVIHLGHATDDIHSVDMALHMGTNLAKHGARVTLFLDREGVRIADQRLPIDTLTWGENNIGVDYDDFVAAGGQVLVCPGCAGNQSLTAEFLRDGAVLGTTDSVAQLMLSATKVIDF
jgi:predicted peroxiredoxin